MAGAREARSCWRPARTSARWSSPATTGRASCWPRALRVFVNRYGVVPGRAHRDRHHRERPPIRRRRISRPAGLEVTIVDLRPHNDCAVEAAGCAPPAARSWPAHTVARLTGRKRVSGLIVAPVGRSRRDRARRRTLPCDCVGISGGWTPAVHLFSQSRGKLGFDARSTPSSRARPCRPSGRPAPRSGTYQLSACLPKAGAGAAAAAAGSDARSFAASADADRLPAGPPAADGTPRPTRARLRRLAERRDGQGHRARRARGLRVDRAREALHHDGHGDGPGQDIEHECPRPRRRRARQARAGGRHDHVPAALYARHLRGARRAEPRRAVRSRPHDADPRLGRRRRAPSFEDVGLWKRARYFPQRGEDMHAAVARECRAVRARVGIFDASTLGKIEVVGPDAAEFLNRIYTNAFARARAGPLPLRPDAEGGRLHLRRRRRRPPRPRPLPRDDDDRRRRARARSTWRTTCRRSGRASRSTSRRSPSSMPSSRCRGRRRASVLAPLVDGIDLGERGASRTCRCATASSAACRAGCSASRSRASSATRSTCPPTTGSRSGRR